MTCSFCFLLGFGGDARLAFGFPSNLRASATWWSSVWTSYGVRYETVTRIMRDGCSITKISEIDHSKQTEISWNWRSKKEKSISQEWKHISLICEKHLKAYLILLRYNNNFTIYQVFAAWRFAKALLWTKFVFWFSKMAAPCCFRTCHMIHCWKVYLNLFWLDADPDIERQQLSFLDLV